MQQGVRWVPGAMVLVLAGCLGARDEAPADGVGVAATSAAAAAARPAASDESGLRAAASRALAEQRLYAPAGDNAVEHYLALRVLAPGDRDVETALLELLPYALIGSEQAIARADFVEARRLVALVQRVDAQLPALSRLRDQLLAEEAGSRRAAERAAREAEEAARRQEAARLAAAAPPAPAATSVVAPETPRGPAPVQAARAATDATDARSSPVASAPLPAPRPAGTPPPSTARRPEATAPLPRLLSAPQPRYPLVALRRKLEGDVVLELRIEADGRVGQARVVSADPPGAFDEAAVAAASRWRFEPGPGAVTTRQLLRFRLPKEG